MSLFHVTAAGGAVLCIALVAPMLGFRRTLALLLIGAVTVGPKALKAAVGPRYVGIAPAEPTYYTFTIVGAILLVVLCVSNARSVLRGLRWWVPFLLADLYAYEVVWPRGSLTFSGELQLLSAVGCFVAGYAVVQANILKAHDLPRLFYAVASVEACTVLLSLLGHPVIHPHGPQAADLAGRSTGTTDHPDQLAKLMLLGIGAMLSYRPASPGEGRLQRLGLIASVGLIALTLGRAAFVGAVVGIVAYVFLEPERRFRRRQIAAALAATVITCASGVAFIGRFERDPSGGVRSELTAVALRAIHMAPWSGVGPNHYVESVGRWDAVTASGVPVHDMFLLTAAELGLVVAALFWLPLVALVLHAIRKVRAEGPAGVVARAVVAITPGLLLTGLTGWGLLQEPTLELFGAVAGAWLGGLAIQARRTVVVREMGLAV